MTEDSTHQAQLIKDEMMFWFKQELRRRDRKIDDLQRKYENDLRDQMTKLSRSYEADIDTIKRKHEADLEAEMSRSGKMRLRLEEIEKEKFRISAELAKWLVPRADFEVQTAISYASYMENATQTELDEYTKSLEHEAAILKDRLEKIQCDDNETREKMDNLTKLIKERESEIEFLHDLMLQEKEETEHQIARMTEEAEFQLKSISKRHETALEIQKLHVSEAVTQRDNSLTRIKELENEFNAVKQNLALELQSRALSESHTKKQHQDELRQMQSRHDDLIQKSNTNLTVLQSELAMVREELNNSRLECATILKKEKQYQLQLQEIRSKTETQIMENSFEVENYKKTIKRQSRRIAQLNSLLKQAGIEIADSDPVDDLRKATKEEGGKKPVPGTRRVQMMNSLGNSDIRKQTTRKGRKTETK